MDSTFQQFHPTQQSVLLLFNDQHECKNIEDVLERSGYETVVCSTPEEAIANIAIEIPNLLVVQADPKISNAAEFVLRVHTEMKGLEIPVIFLLLEYSSDIEWIGQLSGRYTYFLSKPYAIQQLLEIASTMIETVNISESWKVQALERLSRNQDDPEAYLLLGKAANSKLFNSAAAIEAFQRAIKIAPNYFEAHLALGKVLASNNAHDEAVYHYLEAIFANPTCAEAYFYLGISYEYLHKKKQAYDAWKKAVEFSEGEIHNQYLKYLQYHGPMQ